MSKLFDHPPISRPRGRDRVTVRTHTYLRRKRASGVLSARYLIWDKLDSVMDHLTHHVERHGLVPGEREALGRLVKRVEGLAHEELGRLSRPR